MMTHNAFFQIVKLLNGLDDDFALGINCYKSFNSLDTIILNLLFTKALKYDKRHRFVKELKLVYTPIELTGKNVNQIIKQNGDNVIYKKILLKIMLP
jgi:hypothetical protein